MKTIVFATFFFHYFVLIKILQFLIKANFMRIHYSFGMLEVILKLKLLATISIRTDEGFTIFFKNVFSQT